MNLFKKKPYKPKGSTVDCFKCERPLLRYKKDYPYHKDLNQKYLEPIDPERNLPMPYPAPGTAVVCPYPNCGGVPNIV